MAEEAGRTIDPHLFAIFRELDLGEGRTPQRDPRLIPFRGVRQPEGELAAA